MVYARRATRPKPLKSELYSFGAPVGGWISNRSLANPDQPGVQQGAAVLDNFFPTASVVRLRRGRALFTTLPADPVSLFSYNNGAAEKLYAASNTTIYDITSGTPVAVVTGKTGGDWTVVQFATTGGVFLIGVNGVDTGFIYDGNTFSALAATFTGGATTASMSHVWVYKNRLWFAQKNTMVSWFLPIDSIAGAADSLPMGGIFGKGGTLLFGQAWSLDAGEEGGLSEQNVFCSSKGEVAVFQGDDPTDAATWRKVGVYRIGTPLGKNAFVRGGGDIAIATSVGLVPLSKAISLDITSLNVATISYNIADAWSDAVAQRGLTGWCCDIWPELKMAFVSPPDLVGTTLPVVFVSNTETGAWCRFTNWRMLCTEVFQGEMYFGSPGGKVYRANRTGMDEDTPYTGAVVPLFQNMGSPASLKIGKVGRTVMRSYGQIMQVTSLCVDYDARLGAVPNASLSNGLNIWGSGTWGNSTWGSIEPNYVSQDWQSLGGAGYALSLGCQITSGAVAALDAEVVRMEITFTTATFVT